MAYLESFLRFEHVYREGLHCYVVRAEVADLLTPIWRGLWKQDYSDDANLNPWYRHAINNNDGEALAVWRALTWALTTGRSRFAIPNYYRDETARLLGIERESVQLVRWEYEVNVEEPEWLNADIGFVPARTAVSMRPAPDSWQRDHAAFAGLFELTSFRHLTELALAVGGDATSEISVFALRDPGRARLLASALNRAQRPALAETLQPGDIFIDLAVVHDLGAGVASYLSVKTPEAIDEVDHLAEHYSEAFRCYANRAREIHPFDEFHTAIDDLLTQPPASRPADDDPQPNAATPRGLDGRAGAHDRRQMCAAHTAQEIRQPVGGLPSSIRVRRVSKSRAERTPRPR
ncbi:hypothetical protein [Paractinoplanes rishiriensis]|uniref:Uncharacterized protein n=1 Tax=Paractinoplanes rishiriensis TaxID=1050105 RepID=A0A919N1R6_9ACTN|nr:hypothetical protein [Actinoplanes rishiriensis]GIF02156.1 hypothetical protein Ari01nite_96200 [Actinoplanes rishiriensis]